MAKQSPALRSPHGVYSGVLVCCLGLAGCGGGGGSSAPRPPSPPPPPSQSLSQTVSVVNDVDIDYRATLTNVSQATRSITRDGSQLSTTTITTSPYTEILDSMRKGNYSFRLEASGVTPHTASLAVPNYTPTSNFDSLNTDLNEIHEGSSKTFNLETLLSDKNPEDRPVPLNSATSLDSKTQTSISGHNLTITAAGAPGPYQVQVNFGSTGGGSGSGIVAGQILEVPAQIAFWSFRGGNEDVYLMNEDGSGIKRLTTNPGQDLYPRFSPDGKRIVFVTNRDTDTALYIMNGDGTNQTRLTTTLDYSNWPDWCSDGKIVFTSPFPGGIAKINQDGTGFEQLVVDSTASHPSCSPEGTKIAFETSRDGNFEVYVKDLSTGIETNITNDPETDGVPNWSKQNHIFFRSTRSGTADLYRMDSNGANVTQLTSDLGIETDPAISPDGEKLAFTHDLDLSNPQIFIVKSDGTGGWTLITFSGFNRYPAWRPR